MIETRVQLIQRIARTQTVESFRFKPAEKFDYIPGQFLQLIFDEVDKNNKTLNKYLSFSCAPGKEYIEVTKRLSQSEFSGRLKSMAIGDTVLVRAPLGTCVFKPEYTKIAFVIGGIGITPAISIIEDIVGKNLDSDVVVVYSNRSEDDVAFKAELDTWVRQSSNIRSVYTFTGCQPRAATCFFGCIDESLLRNQTPDLKERIVFIFGPPKMVESLRCVCEQVGCSRESLRIENFVGY
jgi:ferredoxin-NADP reductase